MPIDPLPSISRSDANFRTQVDDFFLTKLPAFSTQAESARVQIVAAESTTTSAASTASTDATTATTAANTATSARDSAVTAKNAAETAAAQAVSGNVATPIHEAVSKTTPVDADELGLSDSAASWGLKKLTFANLKAWIGSFFVSKSGDTINGNLNFGGAGRRITGDFTNATIANRAMFQTNVVDGGTIIEVIPNGAGSIGQVAVASSSDPINSSVGQMRVDTGTGDVRFASFQRGTGALLPMTFHVGSAERLRIDATGNVLVTGGGALGYGVGSGGTATQGSASGKGTAVTINKLSGRITMDSADLAAGASIGFVVNNSLVAATDLIAVAGFNGGVDPGNYRIECIWVGSQSFAMRVTNTSAFNRGEGLVINFLVYRGTTS